MKITWVTRSFRDYRIPVYSEINRLSGNNLSLIYYEDTVPIRVQNKIKKVLGNNAIPMSGELRIIGKKYQALSLTKKNKIRIPFQPGLIKTIKKTNPDLLISDGFFQWTYAPLILRLIKNIPHVMCYEGTEHTERNVSKIRTLYRKVASKWIDSIACNGILSQTYLINLGYNKNSITLGNMAADSTTLTNMVASISEQEVENFKNKYKINSPIYIYVGRLVPIKGINYLIKAWSEFTNQIDGQATLLIVGSGPQEVELKQQANQLKIQNIVFTGDVDYDQLAIYYKVSDAFIIPTLQDNWSLVVPEAMSAGLPIICSMYNGCWPELVTKENGWVFDPLNNQEFVDTLEHTLDHKDSFASMGKKSQQIVNNHSPEKAAQSIWQACNMAYNKMKH